MSVIARTSFIVCVACLLGATSYAQTPALPKGSPFMPAGGSELALAQDENYEFTAIATIGGKTSVNIHDKAEKKGRWIAVGETKDEIEVVRCESTFDRVVLRVRGVEKNLRLRQPAAPVAIAPSSTLRRLGPAATSSSTPVGPGR